MIAVHIGSGEPCPRCTPLAQEGALRGEMVMPLHPDRARNPLARDGSGKCCADCGAADGLVSQVGSFVMARVAVGSCRQEQLRLPGPFGLVRAGRMRPCAPGDLGRHLDWLESNGIGLTGDEYAS